MPILGVTEGIGDHLNHKQHDFLNYMYSVNILIIITSPECCQGKCFTYNLLCHSSILNFKKLLESIEAVSG
jgi:hypothetical protein